MNKEQTIKFKFKFPDNYNPVYCNGAYGGVSSQNDIIINFYMERMPIPNSVTNIIQEDGILGEQIEIDPEDYNNTIIRYVNSGVILNEKTAKAIHKCLGQQIEELERRNITNDEICDNRQRNWSIPNQNRFQRNRKSDRRCTDH